MRRFVDNEKEENDDDDEEDDDENEVIDDMKGLYFEFEYVCLWERIPTNI